MTEHKLPALRGPLTAKQIAKKMASGHSVFSPSGAEMTTTCAESLVINALAPDDTNIDSATGTVAHWLAEKWLKSGKRPDRWIGRTRTVKDFTIEIDEETHKADVIVKHRPAALGMRITAAPRAPAGPGNPRR